MRTRYQWDNSMLPILGMAFLLSACSATVNWDYPRSPSNTFAHPETTTVGALFQEAADKHPEYPASLLFGKAVRRLWLGWRWPT